MSKGSYDDVMVDFNAVMDAASSVDAPLETYVEALQDMEVSIQTRIEAAQEEIARKRVAAQSEEAGS